MTRRIGKSVKLSAVFALLVLMAMGIEEVFADNQAQIDLYEFEKLLDEIGKEILSTDDLVETMPNTTETIQVDHIKAHFSYIEAFDEVIRSQFH